MITREEAVNAVELMVLLRGRHEQAFDERAAVDLERWEALRESHGDRRAAGIIAISPRVAELNKRIGYTHQLGAVPWLEQAGAPIHEPAFAHTRAISKSSNETLLKRSELLWYIQTGS